MKLKCIKGMATHWANQFIYGELYDVVSIGKFEQKINTDSEKYTELVAIFLKKASSIGHGHGQTEEQLKLHRENNSWFDANNIYEKQILLDFATIIDEGGREHMFCINSYDEIYEKSNTNKETFDFSHTVHMIDEFFDSKPLFRNKKLERILNGNEN